MDTFLNRFCYSGYASVRTSAAETVAKACRFSWLDSLKIGAGMMTRGEVALIITNKGLGLNIIDSSYFTAVILLIIVSSVVTPIILKLLFKKHEKASPQKAAAAK